MELRLRSNDMKIMIMSCSSKNAWYKVSATYMVVRKDNEYYYVKSKGTIEKVPKKDVEAI